MIFFGLAKVLAVVGSLFGAPSLDLNSLQESQTCMALNLFHETRGQSAHEMTLVANVTMNRVESSAFPDTVCKVVYQRHQFSWTAHPYNIPAITRRNAAEMASWNQANMIAWFAVTGLLPDHTNNSLFYHADYVRPGWSRSQKVSRVTPIGHSRHHIFYRMR